MAQNTQIAHQTIDYVYGRDITTLSKADLINSIKQAQNEIKELKNVGVESTFVDSQVAGLTDAITKMVARLDA